MRKESAKLSPVSFDKSIGCIDSYMHSQQLDTDTVASQLLKGNSRGYYYNGKSFSHQVSDLQNMYRATVVTERQCLGVLVYRYCCTTMYIPVQIARAVQALIDNPSNQFHALFT